MSELIVLTFMGYSFYFDRNNMNDEQCMNLQRLDQLDAMQDIVNQKDANDVCACFIELAKKVYGITLKQVKITHVIRIFSGNRGILN